MSQAQLIAQAPTGPFTLPKLDYAFDALEPSIDAQTMQIHHDRHHAAYVNNLNVAAAKAPELAKMTPEQIVANLDKVPAEMRSLVRNNAGGHLNHTFFWQCLKKNDGNPPSAELGKAIDKKYTSYAKFQEEFTAAAMGVFGSGWAWLVADAKTNELDIIRTPNQDNPWMQQGKKALLGIDVWEHAYYLKYQNRRADYVKAFYAVINWDFVQEQLAKKA